MWSFTVQEYVTLGKLFQFSGLLFPASQGAQLGDIKAHLHLWAFGFCHQAQRAWAASQIDKLDPLGKIPRCCVTAPGSVCVTRPPWTSPSLPKTESHCIKKICICCLELARHPGLPQWSRWNVWVWGTNSWIYEALLVSMTLSTTVRRFVGVFASSFFFTFMLTIVQFQHHLWEHDWVISSLVVIRWASTFYKYLFSLVCFSLFSLYFQKSRLCYQGQRSIILPCSKI